MFLINLLWFIYGANFCKVGQAAQDLSQIELFDFFFLPLTLMSR